MPMVAIDLEGNPKHNSLWWSKRTPRGIYRMPTVMFDIDGVLRDFISEWRRGWTEHFGNPPVCDDSAWEQLAQAAIAQGMTAKEGYRLIFDEWGWELMTKAKPYEYAKRAVEHFWFYGWSVIMGTHQMNNSTIEATKLWLAHHEIPYDHLVITDNKAAIRADVYFEDKPTTIRALVERYPDAVVVRVAHPCNECVAGVATHSVKNLKEIRAWFA